MDTKKELFERIKQAVQEKRRLVLGLRSVLRDPSLEVFTNRLEHSLILSANNRDFSFLDASVFEIKECLQLGFLNSTFGFEG